MHSENANSDVLHYSFVFRRVRKIEKANIIFVISVSFSVYLSVCLSIRSSTWNDSFLIGMLLKKYDISVYVENLSKIFKFHYNLTRLTGTLHEDPCTFIIPSWILLRMRNVSDKIVEKFKTHISCSTFFFFNRVVYEITWKNTLGPDMPQTKIQRLRIA